MPADSRMRRPSSSLVPVRRTTISTRDRASTMPRAMSSPRVMTPKMLISSPRTPGLRTTISIASFTFSVAAQPEAAAELPGLIGVKSKKRIDGAAGDLVGGRAGDLLDVYTSGSRCDHTHAPGRAVDGERQIVLGADLRRFGDH